MKIRNYSHKNKKWQIISSIMGTDIQCWLWCVIYERVWLNGLWFVIHNEVWNFCKEIVAYHEPFYNKIKNMKNSGVINGSVTFK